MHPQTAGKSDQDQRIERNEPQGDYQTTVERYEKRAGQSKSTSQFIGQRLYR